MVHELIAFSLLVCILSSVLGAARSPKTLSFGLLGQRPRKPKAEVADLL
jgi:hypothetical protein